MTLKITTSGKGFSRPALYYGLYSRIARQLGVTPSVVRRVVVGTTKSKRIEQAVEREIARIEKLASKAA